MDTMKWRDDTISFLDNIRDIMKKFDYEVQANKARNWSQQLSESRYNVAFMGRIKVGKSTLLNALLEEELFPVGPVPLTPAITKLVRDEELARVIWTEKDKGSQILLDERNTPAKRIHAILVDRFNTLNEQYAQELKILLTDRSAVEEHTVKLPLVTVDVRYPLGPDMEGVVLVDTPGAGDLSRARVDVLLDFIPRADAAVVVLNATQPLNKEEGDFIRKQLWDKGIRQLFFVLNRFDQLNTDEDRKETFEHVRNMLRTQLGEDPHLYPVSGYLALCGIQWRDAKVDWDEKTRQDRVLRTYKNPEELLQESGIQRFRDDLWQFLDGTGRIAFQIHSALEKVKMELTVLQDEVEITERLISGELMLDSDDAERQQVVDAVQLVMELGKRAKAAGQSLTLIEEGKQAVQAHLKTARTKRLPDLPALSGSLGSDRYYLEMCSNLRTVIETHKLKELTGTEEEEGILERRVKLELAAYARNVFSDVSGFVEEVVYEALPIAEEHLGAALQKVEDIMGRKMAMTTELVDSISVENPPWVGRAFAEGLMGAQVGTGVAAGLVIAALVLTPVLLPAYIVGIGAAGGFTAAWLRRTKKRKEELESELLSNIERVVRSNRSKLKRETTKVFDKLEKMILNQLDAKRGEIESLLQKYEAEGADAHKTVEHKEQWLTAFKPELETLLSHWHRVAGQSVVPEER